MRPAASSASGPSASSASPSPSTIPSASRIRSSPREPSAAAAACSSAPPAWSSSWPPELLELAALVPPAEQARALLGPVLACRGARGAARVAPLDVVLSADVDRAVDDELLDHLPPRRALPLPPRRQVEERGAAAVHLV